MIDGCIELAAAFVLAILTILMGLLGLGGVCKGASGRKDITGGMFNNKKLRKALGQQGSAGMKALPTNELLEMYSEIRTTYGAVESVNVSKRLDDSERTLMKDSREQKGVWIFTYLVPGKLLKDIKESNLRTPGVPWCESSNCALQVMNLIGCHKILERAGDSADTDVKKIVKKMLCTAFVNTEILMKIASYNEDRWLYENLNKAIIDEIKDASKCASLFEGRWDEITHRKDQTIKEESASGKQEQDDDIQEMRAQIAKLDKSLKEAIARAELAEKELIDSNAGDRKKCEDELNEARAEMAKLRADYDALSAAIRARASELLTEMQERHEEEIDRIEQQKSEIEIEKNAAVEKLAKTKQKRDDLMVLVRQQEDENEELKNRYKELESEAESALHELDTCNEAKQMLEMEKQALEEERTNMTDKLREKESTVEELRMKLEEQEKTIEGDRIEIEGINDMIDAVVARLKEVEAQRDELAHEKNLLNNQIGELRSKLENSQQIEDDMRKLEQETEFYKTKLEELIGQLQSLMGIIKERDNKITRLKDNKRRIKEIVDEKDAEIQQLKQAENAYNLERDKFIQDLQNMNMDKQIVEGELASVKKDNDMHIANLANLQKALDDLNDAMEITVKDYNQAVVDIHNVYDEKVTALQKERDTNVRQVNHLKNRIVSLEKEITKLRQLRDIKNAQIQRLVQKLADQAAAHTAATTAATAAHAAAMAAQAAAAGVAAAAAKANCDDEIQRASEEVIMVERPVERTVGFYNKFDERADDLTKYKLQLAAITAVALGGKSAGAKSLAGLSGENLYRAYNEEVAGLHKILDERKVGGVGGQVFRRVALLVEHDEGARRKLAAMTQDVTGEYAKLVERQ